MGEDKKAFTKTDMERVGLFQEMEKISIGDPYKPPNIMNGFNTAAGKGKQMIPGGSKMLTSSQAGYFNEKFIRVFESEGYSDPIRRRRQQRLKDNQKMLGKPFMPSNGDKKPSGLGSFYGTIAGPVSAFSPLNRPKAPYKPPGKNVLTNPGKKGTGFGYVDVTINKYPEHSADDYFIFKKNMLKENELHRQKLKAGAFRLNMHPRSYFDENPYKSDKEFGGPKKHPVPREVKPFKPSSPGKKPGGNKSGTFDPYPSHSNDPYINKMAMSKNVINKSGRIFMPSAGPKSAPISSVVDTNVVKAINKTNYNTITSVVY